MHKLLLATCAVCGLAVSAQAANITTFSQTSGSNTIVATDNGTATTISVSNAALSIGQLITGSPPATVFFDLTATSVDAVQPIGSAVIQHYSGNFCITSAINCGGTNVLSGTFTDAAFGALGGPGLVVNVNNPPDTLAFTSSIIPQSELAAPNSFGLTFTNLTPALHIDGTTIGAFTASFAGSASSSAVPVPEPTALAVLAMGVTVLGFIRRRHS